MLYTALHPSEAAQALFSHYGRKAPQKVADAIQEAVRNCDMPLAKRWDAIGRELDRKAA